MRRDSSSLDGITTEKIGRIWHGRLEIDKRGLTEEIARTEVLRNCEDKDSNEAIEE